MRTLTNRCRCRGRLYPVLVSVGSFMPVSSRLSVVCKNAEMIYSLLQRQLLVRWNVGQRSLRLDISAYFRCVVIVD